MGKLLQWPSIYRNAPILKGFPGGSGGKASARNAGDLGSIPGLGRSPGEGNGDPLLPGESHGQRSLAGYSPWGRKSRARLSDYTTTTTTTHLKETACSINQSLSSEGKPGALLQTLVILRK